MPQHLRVTRSVTTPDPVKLARYRRVPDLGPRALFFTGGTALRDLSREIISSTHNSIHVMTPFDSGGSSATIRQAFGMLAVGDIRNRLMALADRTLKGNPEIFDLFATRLPTGEANGDLRARLDQLVRGKDPMVAAVPDPMRKIIRSHLGFFRERMPEDFDLRGASIGNLILTGGYFNQRRHIDPVIYLFTKLVEARGTVRPVVNRNAHLAAELEDGSVVVGQHRLTGKEVPPISSPVVRLWATLDPDNPQPADLPIRDKMRRLINSAEIIVYPIGSFYTSLVANLLPRGVGDAIRTTECPKVYVPNVAGDPEMKGLSVAGAVKTLFGYLERGCSAKASRDSLLNFILVDSKNADYGGPLELDRIRRFGVEVIDTTLVSEESVPLLDPHLLIQHLLSLV